MKKNYWPIMIIVFWVVVLGLLVGINEYTLKTGEEVILKTVPVDPRDLFRGDYMILRYDISTLNANDIFIPQYLSEGDTVYVALKEENGTHTASRVSTTKPEGLAIKGTIKRIFTGDINTVKRSITIEYGIESYFIPEGTGRNFARITEAKIAIDGYGNSKIKAVLNEGNEIDISKIPQKN